MYAQKKLMVKMQNDECKMQKDGVRCADNIL